MTKAALSLNELDEIWSSSSNVDLEKIEIVEADQRTILKAKLDVERGADGLLARGMEAQNQSQIGVAVQVFQNLGILEKKLDTLVKNHVGQIKKKLQDALVENTPQQQHQQQVLFNHYDFTYWVFLPAVQAQVNGHNTCCCYYCF